MSADVILKENTDHAVKSIFVAALTSYRIAFTMKKDNADEKNAATILEGIGVRSLIMTFVSMRLQLT